MRSALWHTASVQCLEGKTMCLGGERCISQSAQCDGFYDCPDQSDEDPEICSLYSHLLHMHCMGFITSRLSKPRTLYSRLTSRTVGLVYAEYENVYAIYSVSQKNPPLRTCGNFFQNGWEFFNQNLRAYYVFLSMLDYKFLFNYLQLWRSYAILSVITQFTSCAQGVHHRLKRTLAFSDIFPKQLGIFSPNFTNLLNVHMHARVQIFIQLSSTMTKLCHIKCDHPTCVSVDSGHFEHIMVVALKMASHNFAKVADNWIKICSPAQIGMCNRRVKFGLKLSNHLGKNFRKFQGGIFFWLTLYYDIMKLLRNVVSSLTSILFPSLPLLLPVHPLCLLDVATGVYRYIYPPKIRLRKRFMW